MAWGLSLLSKAHFSGELIRIGMKLSLKVEMLLLFLVLFLLTLGMTLLLVNIIVQPMIVEVTLSKQEIRFLSLIFGYFFVWISLTVPQILATIIAGVTRD